MKRKTLALTLMLVLSFSAIAGISDIANVGVAIQLLPIGQCFSTTLVTLAHLMMWHRLRMTCYGDLTPCLTEQTLG